MTILVMEDSRLIRIAIERILSRAGYHVIAVRDGKTGVRQAQEKHPDAILLDMMLPSLDGIGVLRELKQCPITRPIPVIVLSGLSQKNEAKLRAAGAVAYFEKSNLALDGDGQALIQAIQQVVTENAQPNG